MIQLNALLWRVSYVICNSIPVPAPELTHQTLIASAIGFNASNAIANLEKQLNARVMPKKNTRTTIPTYTNHSRNKNPLQSIAKNTPKIRRFLDEYHLWFYLIMPII